jgi:hypothetical protein
MILDGEKLNELSYSFDKKLSSLKKLSNESFDFYPYGILNNFIHLKKIFNKYPLNILANSKNEILDIGAADGDLSFFLETLGFKLSIVENKLSNFNSLKGVFYLKKTLHSKVQILECDIDQQFKLTKNAYDLIFLLGILYHLKNPYYNLEQLSYSSTYVILSTRVAKFTPDKIDISNSPLAYLLHETESNNDKTNFWIFSIKGLERILNRTGFDILEMYTVGEKFNSNPSDNNLDERAFCLLKSKNKIFQN